MRYLFFALFLTLAVVACKNSGEQSAATETESTTEVDKSGPEYTSAYICPMHCKGSGSAEPGKCPACGMDYVANEDYKADEHEGHNH